MNRPLDGEMLSAYLDNALTPQERAFVTAHLNHSAEARRQLEDLQHIRQSFASWKPVRPDAFFVRRVEARIAQEMQARDPVGMWGIRIQRVAVAAMLFLTLGGMAFLMQLRQELSHTGNAETFLSGFFDREITKFGTLAESDVSRDTVLDLVLTENIR